MQRIICLIKIQQLLSSCLANVMNFEKLLFHLANDISHA